MALRRTPIRIALVVATVLAAAGVGATLAAHGPGFHSTPLADGTWTRSERTGFLSALAGQGRLATSRVVTVSAVVDPMSSIDWHGHPGPSVVVVTGRHAGGDRARPERPLRDRRLRGGHRLLPHRKRPSVH